MRSTARRYVLNAACAAEEFFTDMWCSNANRTHETERATQLGFVMVERNERPTFGQPCPKLEGNRCSIYPDRPSACVSYRCRLLDRYLAGDVDKDQARALIDEARDRVSRLRALMPGKTMSELRRRWARGVDGFLSGNPDPAETECRAFVELTALGVFLDRYFVLDRESKQVIERQIVT